MQSECRMNLLGPLDPDDTTLVAESEEEQKSLLMKVKEESEKVGLKLNMGRSQLCSRGSPLRLGTRRERGRGGANPGGAPGLTGDTPQSPLGRRLLLPPPRSCRSDRKSVV